MRQEVSSRSPNMGHYEHINSIVLKILKYFGWMSAVERAEAKDQLFSCWTPHHLGSTGLVKDYPQRGHEDISHKSSKVWLVHTPVPVDFLGWCIPTDLDCKEDVVCMLQ